MLYRYKICLIKNYGLRHSKMLKFTENTPFVDVFHILYNQEGS